MYDAKPEFSDSYSESRQKFLDAMAGTGEVQSIKHSRQGPEGEDLYMDFGILGPKDAKAGLVIISGTHGPEGLCGSGAQVGFLNSGMAEDVSDMRVILIHAHNPYGFAWDRRTNEDNIDLNRNYYDFSIPFTPHPGYDEIRPVIVPEVWNSEKLAAGMAAYEKEHGKVGLLAAMVTGQSHDAAGMFYRGEAPSWSRKVVEEVLPQLLAGQSQVGIVDYHTGLGPFGVPYIVHGYKKESEEYAAFTKAFEGDVRSLDDTEEFDEDLPAAPEGPIVLAFDTILPGKQHYAVVIEYGTYEPNRVFSTLMHDNWLHAHGDLKSAEARAIKAEVREVFYPDSDEWKDMIWERTVWSINCMTQLLRDQSGA